MTARILALALALCLGVTPALAAKKALFDNTHAETAGNADWIIDTDQPLPVPDQATVTWATPETYWLGSNSAWGIDLVKRGYQVATLTSAFGITYQNQSNPYDLSNYDVFIVNEPNTVFTPAESTAIYNYVHDGGGLFAISDHNGSDRNNDGIDSPAIWNKFDFGALNFGVHFGVTGDPNNSITQVSTNVRAALSDSIIHGAAGTATGISFHAGTTMTLTPANNPSVTGDVWMNASPNGGTTGAMVAHLQYGAGRIVFVTDSSPADDGTGSGGTVFNGWGELAGAEADSLIFLNGTIWATRSGATSDTQAPAVAVTSPTGGENWLTGSAHNITWAASDNVGVTSVDLAYSTNGGATFPNVIATGIANSGTYAWTVPGSATSSARVRVTAHDAAGNVGADSSHANFSFVTPEVIPPTVTVTSPVGGESWGAGTQHAVTWTASDNVGVTSVDLAYSLDGGASFASPIATGLANTGSFNWTLPGVLSSTARVRVTAHDAAGNVGADSSHADFAITGWTVTASAGANGTIAPSGAVVVADGASPAFTITPAGGFHVADVLVNGVSVGAVTNYTFAPVHGDETIAASFAASDNTVTVTVVGNGSVTKSPDQPTYTGGSTVQLTATPDPGWTFAGWSGDATGGTNPLNVLVTGNMNITATFSQHVYNWVATGSAPWTTAGSWNPARTAPATDDVLIFSGGGAVSATAVPTQTIGKLVITNNTAVSFPATGAVTLTMAGSGGLGLDLDPGSTLNVTGSSGNTLALVASTATIGGAVNFTGAAHKLESGNAGGIVFQSGAVMTLGTGFSSNAFGTGAAPSALNSVVFQAGSLLAQSSGANPFGATQPSAVLTFQPGSRYRLDGNLTPSFGGRSYADFELNTPNTITPASTVAWSADSLLISQGVLDLHSMTGGTTLRGSLVVKTGTTLADASAGAVTINLAGTAPNRVHIGGTFNPVALVAFNVNNPAGVTLTTNWTIPGTLNFTAGRLTTGGNTLAIAATGNITGAAQGTGWVAGNLKRNVAAGSSSRTFDVGDAATYAPVTLAVTGAGSAFDLTAVTNTPDHPSLATSDLDPAKSVNRYWTLTPTGSPTLTSYDATFNFAPGDVDGAAQTANFLVRRYSGGTWSTTTAGTRLATSTQATGLTAFGDFAIGDLYVAPTFTITASAGPNGSISPSGAVPEASGADQLFTITPDAGYVVSDVLVDNVSVGAVTAYQFTNVTADHTIAATFQQDLTGVGDGPLTLTLSRPRPNPSMGAVALAFSLPTAGTARIEIVDVNGRRVATHVGVYDAGRYAWQWDGAGAGGARVGAGVYFARLVTAHGTRLQRIALVR